MKPRDQLNEALGRFYASGLSARVTEERRARRAAEAAAEAALLAERRSRLHALHPDKLGREQTEEERVEFTLLSDPLSRAVPPNHPLRKRYAPLIELMQRKDFERQSSSATERRKEAAKKAAATRKAKGPDARKPKPKKPDVKKPAPVSPTVEPKPSSDQRTHETGNGKAEQRIFNGNREQWCNEIVSVMLPMLAEHGITFSAERQVRCAVSPSVRGGALGVCHGSSKSTDGRTNFIDVSTVQAEPVDLAHTLLHELLHACDDCQSGHRGRWKRWADQIGIERQGHSRGPIAEHIVITALAAVGIPAQHVPSHTRKTKRKVSQIKFWCRNEHGHVHMPTLQAVSGHRIACMTCMTQMLCDEQLLATLKGEVA